MEKEVTVLHRVVEAEPYISTEYPRWSDYGCLCRSLRVTYIGDDGGYKFACFTKEDLEPPYICDEQVEIHWATVEEIDAYYDYLFKKRMADNQLSSSGAKKGDIVEIFKGRKYPKGTRFVLTGESYTHYDCYNRPVAWYWVTTTGEHVLISNTKIVGHVPEEQEFYFDKRAVENFFERLGVKKLDRVYADLDKILAAQYQNIAYLTRLSVSDQDDGRTTIHAYVKPTNSKNIHRVDFDIDIDYCNNKED